MKLAQLAELKYGTQPPLDQEYYISCRPHEHSPCCLYSSSLKLPRPSATNLPKSMRLLTFNKDDTIAIESFDDERTPPYAILSHTWGANNEEMTFEEIIKGGGQGKAGYEKIRFCGAQARRDGLQYFWVDTCCINKTKEAELALSIRSMFRWYRNAARCYVYLSDVTSHTSTIKKDHHNFGWLAWIQWSPIFYGIFCWCFNMIVQLFVMHGLYLFPKQYHMPHDYQEHQPEFQDSRWFTRGWTLQELLAPSKVEFFTREGIKIGDKLSLISELSEVTGIPQSALQGTPLSKFTVQERIQWSDHRKTTKPVDHAYSLMGILGVSLSPIEGESRAEAMRRVQHEIDKQNKCIQDLQSTNPCNDKIRIEATKGGLLVDSYHWVLDNSIFQQWQQDPSSRLLWIKGDPGKGKTMLLCGVIDEIQKTMRHNDTIAYFFCQATDSRINNAVAILRGLLYMLVVQQPLLAPHIEKQHTHAGKRLFEDANAWVALRDIFTDILQDPSLGRTYLVVDALDECIADQPKLLDFVAKQSSVSSRIKWIVSSRNLPNIEAQLKGARHKVELSLELNANSISEAVSAFIKQKVGNLATEKHYKPELQSEVLQYLISNANETFLWVALVCQNLEKIPKRHVLRKLTQFPPGLDALYKRMMDQIIVLEDAETCLQVLALVAVSYRPITVLELVALAEQVQKDADDVEEIVALCGSFLTLREDIVYFVHQSAKDFLLTEAAFQIFPDGAEAIHYSTFLRSIEVLSSTLHRDMYDLKAPGITSEDISLPAHDPLASVRYLSTHWADHLCNSSPDLSASSEGQLKLIAAIDLFFRETYLYWIEALSLCQSVEQGIAAVAKVLQLVKNHQSQSNLTLLVNDAWRFIMHHKSMIKRWPLQIYTSGILFSPRTSIIKDTFQDQAQGFNINQALEHSWSACLQTLEGHDGSVTSVAFSSDGMKLASASDDKTVKVWDAHSGACLQTFEGHSSSVFSVAFSPDGMKLASASDDKTVKVWDAHSGACLQTLEGYSRSVISVAFSPDGTKLASGSGDTIIKIWDMCSGRCLQILKGHNSSISLVTFSPDGTKLASASDDKTVKVWNAHSGACLQTLKGHSSSIFSVAFSHDGTRLASASCDSTVKVWDMYSKMCLQTLKGHDGSVFSVAFSPDGVRLASASGDKMVKIWDAYSGACLQTLKGHDSYIISVAFSRDGTRLVSGSGDKTIKIWDSHTKQYPHILEKHSSYVSSVVFSPDGTRLASASGDKTVKIWDAHSGACLQTLKGHNGSVFSVAFSSNGTRLASASVDETVRIWDAYSWQCLQMLEGHSGYVISVAFSRDGTRLASGSEDKTVKIWDVYSGECLQTIEGHDGHVFSVAFSPDGTHVVTNKGNFLLSASIFGTASSVYLNHANNVGREISLNDSWITWSGEKVLWIPPKYRADASTVRDNNIAIATKSSRIWICTVGYRSSRET